MRLAAYNDYCIDWMNIEEPVFNIIHNYRRPERNREEHNPPAENDSEMLEIAEPPSTDATIQSENGAERFDEDRAE